MKVPADFDIWGARLVGKDGKVYGRWRLPADFASNPSPIRYESTREFVADRVEFLDYDEKVLVTWFAESERRWAGGLRMHPGEWFQLTIGEFTWTPRS